jgi:hypothetical protein
MTKQIYVYLKNTLAKIKRRLINMKLEKAAYTLYDEYKTNHELTVLSDLFETEDL